MLGLRALGIAVVLISGIPPGAVAADSPEAALMRAAAAYRASSLLVERLDYAVVFPDGRRESKAIEYGRAGEGRFLAMVAEDGSRIFHVTAAAGALRAVQFNVGSAYLEAPYQGSFAQALEAVGAGRIGLAIPPGLAAAEGGDAIFIESFGFGVLSGLRATAVVQTDDAIEVTLEAEAGSALAQLDSTTGRLTAVSLTVGSGESTVRLEGKVASIEAPPNDPRWRIDTTAREPVADFAALEASAFPLGEAAPELEARSLTDETVRLASLRGRVVVLDFWATWCVPCWQGLEQVERLAAWARESGLPITVWTVDTLEQTSTFADQAALASGFLESRDLDIPVLVDFDDTFFRGMHTPGLPSTVVIAPDGTLAHYHSGVWETMEQELREQAEDLLRADPGSP